MRCFVGIIWRNNLYEIAHYYIHFKDNQHKLDAESRSSRNENFLPKLRETRDLINARQWDSIARWHSKWQKIKVPWSLPFRFDSVWPLGCKNRRNPVERISFLFDNFHRNASPAARFLQRRCAASGEHARLAEIGCSLLNKKEAQS